MSLSQFLVHSCTIQRMAATTGVKKAYAQLAASVPCLIQPLDPEASQRAGMSYGRAYKGFFMIATDIKEGDRIIDQQGRTMGVKGIRQRDYGSNPHLDVLLDQDAAN